MITQRRGSDDFSEARLQVLVIVLVGIGVLLRGEVKCEHVSLCVRMNRGKVARCMDDETVSGMFYLCRNKL